MTDEYDELESDHDYLFDLAKKLRHVAPMHSNTDGGDVDRLREIAGKLRDALKVDLTDEEIVKDAERRYAGLMPELSRDVPMGRGATTADLERLKE